MPSVLSRTLPGISSRKSSVRVQDGDPEECGNVWLFVAFAATQKAVISYFVGKRSAEENTDALALDLRARIVNRSQITSDGYAPYLGAIENAFSIDVDFATIIKIGGDEVGIQLPQP